MSSSQGVQFVAVRIRQFMTLSALGVSDEAQYAASAERRQVDFVTSLINGGDRGCTHEIRLISEPDPAVLSRGRIHVYVVTRVDGGSSINAATYSRKFVRMLEATFPEYEFETVDDGELTSVLMPFDVKEVVEVMRRVRNEDLNSLQPPLSSQRHIGFAQHSGRSEMQKTESHGSILHFFPFVRTGIAFNTLFRLMLAEPNPIAVCIRLRPTSLSASEASFFERSIAECERHGQVSLGAASSDDLSGLRPTLREKAAAHQHHLSRLLFGLRDNAAMMTIHAASTAIIAPFVAEALAALVTQPAGGSASRVSSGISEYLAGGYEVLVRDAAQFGPAMTDLALILPDHLMIPEGLARLPYLFDSVEAAAAFHLPPITSEPYSGVETRSWRRALPPPNIPETGVLLGRTLEPGAARDVRISAEDRLRHTYVVGQTGTGKSTMLRTMIVDDICAGEGVCVLDPHGDLFQDLLGRIPENRLDDVVLIDPTDMEFPVGMNVLEYNTDAERFFIIQEFSSIITRLMTDSYGDAAYTMIGPLFLQHLRMNLLLTMSNVNDPGTLLEFYQIFQEENYWHRWMPLGIDDPLLQRWVSTVLPATNYIKQGSEGTSMGGYVSSKLEGFLFDPMLRHIFAQKRSSIRLREAMDSGKIVLVNLAKGSLTEANSKFLGMVILAQLQAAALGRSRMPASERRPFYVYVDEFQSIATEGFITMLSEARKFGLGLVLANQFTSQISNEKIMSSIFGNVGTIVCFRLGESDAERMEKELSPALGRSDLLDIPNWQAYVSTLIQNQTVRPFEIRTTVGGGEHDALRAHEVRARARRRYGTARVEVRPGIGEP